jgi:hypothetical protein
VKLDQYLPYPLTPLAVFVMLLVQLGDWNVITTVAVHTRPMSFCVIRKREITVCMAMTVNHKLFHQISISWCVHIVCFMCIHLFCLDTDVNVFVSQIFC